MRLILAGRVPAAESMTAMNRDARELAANFDLEKLPPEFYDNPYPTYRALREQEPVKRMPDGGCS